MMGKEFSIIKLDKLSKVNGWVLLLNIAILFIGILCLLSADMQEVPTYYASSNNDYELMIQKNDGETSYYINGIVIPQVYSMTSEDGLDKLHFNNNDDEVEYYINEMKLTQEPPKDNKYSYNFNFWGDGMLTIGLILGLGGLYLLFKSSNSFQAYTNKLIFRRSKNEIINIPRIPSAPNGIIAIRAWKVDKHGFLKSSVQGVKWESKKVQSDELPNIKSTNGMYAYRLGGITAIHLEEILSNTWGVVSLTGKCVGHGDNILRSKYCTILALITKKANLVELLKQRYDCPVYFSTNPLKSINTWLFTAEGIFWMNNNHKIIENKIMDKFRQDIDEVMARNEL